MLRFPRSSAGLFQDFHGCTFYGRDVFSLISDKHRSFREILARHKARLGFCTLRFQFNRMWTASYYSSPPEHNLKQPSSTYTIIWLREFTHVDTFSPCFDIDPSSVVRIVCKVLPELWRYFQNQISCPTLPEWRNPMGNREEFLNAKGAIDTTPH